MAQCDHTFLLDRLTDHDEGLPSGLAIGDDVVRNAPIEFVDLTPWHELVDLDRVRVSNRDGFQLIVGYLHVLTLANLVPFDDVLITNRLTGHGIELTVFDPIAGLPIDLVKFDSLSLGDRREQLNRTRNQR